MMTRTLASPATSSAEMSADGMQDLLGAQQQWFAQCLAMQQAVLGAWWNWQLGWWQPWMDTTAWASPWARELGGEPVARR